MNLYVASKANMGDYWKVIRQTARVRYDVRIISSWIDESGEGESESMEALWVRCIQEAASCDAVLALHRSGDVWKGAFVEIGAALAAGKHVFVIGDPPGSWVHHPLVHRIPEAAASQNIETVIAMLRESWGKKFSDLPSWWT